jgi:hypothetical protein
MKKPNHRAKKNAKTTPAAAQQNSMRSAFIEKHETNEQLHRMEQDQDVATRPTVSFANGKFVALAKRFGVTPEFLALVAMRDFAADPPEGIEIISDYPLADRPCRECILRNDCASANQTDREACFLASVRL